MKKYTRIINICKKNCTSHRLTRIKGKCIIKVYKKKDFSKKEVISLSKHNIFKGYVEAYKKEFAGYNANKLGKDILAGVTVAAVALPLALAFGVSSGASAAAGLITAIIAGIIMGLLSGSSYQMSGPTGAMAAILVSIVVQYEMKGVFIACFLSGIILLLAGIFKLGEIVSFIPMPVITGFTSGIAAIIALGQIDNISGLSSSGDTTVSKISSYFTTPQSINLTALAVGGAVILLMIIYPKKLTKFCPSSLAAIILATAASAIFKLPVESIGAIPRTIFLDTRLKLSDINLDIIKNLIMPAVSIAALGLIESLLCGASAGRMKNEKLRADQELISQGVGNIIIPFFGGVPATAAIARTSVAIKAGGQTRLTSVIHALVILLSMIALGGIMSEIPLPALAGVLMVTAWRMNEWSTIKNIFRKKIKTAIFQFLITMTATIIFDLTIAILIGVLFSIVVFVLKVSDMQVNVSDVDSSKLGDSNTNSEKYSRTSVVYITGPLYFGTASRLEEKLSSLAEKDTVILSMRGVPFADLSGTLALQELCLRLSNQNVAVYFTCVQPKVMEMFDRCGIKEHFGIERFYWSTDKLLNSFSK